MWKPQYLGKLSESANKVTGNRMKETFIMGDVAHPRTDAATIRRQKVWAGTAALRRNKKRLGLTWNQSPGNPRRLYIPTFAQQLHQMYIIPTWIVWGMKHIVNAAVWGQLNWLTGNQTPYVAGIPIWCCLRNRNPQNRWYAPSEESFEPTQRSTAHILARPE